MAKKILEVQPDVHIFLTCHGDLAVRGSAEARLSIMGDNFNAQESDKGVVITCHGDLTLVAPESSTLTIEHLSGDGNLTGLDGALAVVEAAGDLSVLDTSGAANIAVVRGDFVGRTRGLLTLGEVYGDASLRSAQEVVINTIYGDLMARGIEGPMTIQAVMGDAGLRGIRGDLTITQVHGDCTLAGLQGQSQVAGADDIRLHGPLAEGKHSFTAGSDIVLHWPEDAPLQLQATSPRIVNRLELLEATTEGNTLTGTLGKGGPHLTLQAQDRISIKPEHSKSREYDLELSLSGLGEMISSEIGSRMAEISARLGPELASRTEERAERLAERVQRSVERAMRKMDLALQRAERQRGRHAAHAGHPTPPRPAAPTKPAAAKADVTQEQYKILKMLEEGKLSVEEANKLLDALSS